MHFFYIMSTRDGPEMYTNMVCLLVYVRMYISNALNVHGGLYLPPYLTMCVCVGTHAQMCMFCVCMHPTCGYKRIPHASISLLFARCMTAYEIQIYGIH